MDHTLKRWIKGLEHSKGIPRMITPGWYLDLVLVTLSKAPFEPILTCPIKFLTWKTAFLLTITSVRRASEMHTLSCDPAYIRFTGSGVILFTDLSFLPKVPTRANTTRPIFMPSMHKHPDKALRFLCVRRTLNEYLRRTGTFKQQGTTVFCRLWQTGQEETHLQAKAFQMASGVH